MKKETWMQICLLCGKRVEDLEYFLMKSLKVDYQSFFSWPNSKQKEFFPEINRFFEFRDGTLLFTSISNEQTNKLEMVVKEVAINHLTKFSENVFFGFKTFLKGLEKELWNFEKINFTENIDLRKWKSIASKFADADIIRNSWLICFQTSGKKTCVFRYDKEEGFFCDTFVGKEKQTEKFNTAEDAITHTILEFGSTPVEEH